MMADTSFMPHKVFIGGLPRKSTHMEVFQLAERFGAVRSIKLIHNKGVQSLGFAFVSFKSVESAKTMVSSKVFLKGALLDCKYTQRHRSIQIYNRYTLKRKIYIGGFSRGLTGGEIKRLFESFGKVEEVILNKCFVSGTSRGSGFVVFAEQSVCDHVLSLSIKRLEGQKMVVMTCVKRSDILKGNCNKDQFFSPDPPQIFLSEPKLSTSTREEEGSSVQEKISKGEKKLKSTKIGLGNLTPDHEVHEANLRFNRRSRWNEVAPGGLHFETNYRYTYDINN